MAACEVERTESLKIRVEVYSIVYCHPQDILSEGQVILQGFSAAESNEQPFGATSLPFC